MPHPLKPPAGARGGSAGAGISQEAVRKRAEGYLSELSAAVQAQVQVPLRVAIVFCFVVGGLLLLLAAHTAWMRHRAGDGDGWASPWMGLLVACAYIGAGIYLKRQRQLSALISRLLVITTLAAYLVSLKVNGFSPALLAGVLVVWTHLLMRPSDALAVSLLIVLSTLLAGMVWFDEVSALWRIRVEIGLVLLTVLMQMVSRQIRHTLEVSHDITKGLQELNRELDLDLRRTETERDQAMLRDEATGLPNARAFAAQAQALLTQPSGEADAWAVAIRMSAMREALASLTPTEQHFMMGRLIARLRDAAGPRALIASLGRLEFGLLLPADGTGAAQMRERIALLHQRLCQPLSSGSSTVVGTPLMGAAAWPLDTPDVRQLIQFAEVALLIAVQTAPAEPVFYEPAMGSALLDRTAMVEAIENGLREHEFELLYQPIFDLGGGPLRKAEALIRWNHPHRGRIGPGEFIPLAESTGQVVALTEWVLRQAAQQVRDLRATVHPQFQVSVNMPPACLEACTSRAGETLKRLLAIDVPDKGLVLEITESALLRVTEEVRDVMSVLKRVGFQIALDDFGMGYSSFSQLDRLPLDVLKIDKVFVDDIERSAPRLAICTAIIRVGHSLGLQIVAEGVETPRQRELLAAAGCDFGQGYGIARPLAAAELQVLARNPQPLAD